MESHAVPAMKSRAPLLLSAAALGLLADPDKNFTVIMKDGTIYKRPAP